MQRRKLISFLWVYGLFPPVTFTLQSVQIVLFRFECSLIWKVPHIKIDEILIWIRNKIELNSESFTISIIDTWMGGRINEVSFFSATNKKIIQFIIEVIWCGIPRYFCTRFSYMEMVMLKPRAVFHEAYRKKDDLKNICRKNQVVDRRWNGLLWRMGYFFKPQPIVCGLFQREAKVKEMERYFHSIAHETYNRCKSVCVCVCGFLGRLYL